LNYQIQGLSLPADITLDRLQHRRSLLAQLTSSFRPRNKIGCWPPTTSSRPARSRWPRRKKTRHALDIRRESDALRDRYGRNLFGQSVLLARRLVEAGVRYVTVHFDAVDGYSWDSHTHSDDVRKFLLPALDNALSSLLNDLSERGLLDENACRLPW